jgi:TonB-dependent SusC/RagA subfamily outer membrane receptor
MIRGRFPGVEVSGTSIKIMGSSSLNVSSEPTFVVDGVFVNDIGNISPQTVKSIEVLKGPAASVYGVKGANGVIVINLLTGKEKR